MNKCCLFLLLTLLPFFINLLSAQTALERGNLQQVLNCAEGYMGTHDLLLNGNPYFDLHALAKGHPYLGGENWTPGTIFAKGRAFEVPSMKYNAEMGKVILKTEFEGGSIALTALNPTLVDSFKIWGHTFVNMAVYTNGTSESMYAEKIYSGGIRFYRKQKKYFIPNYSIAPQGSYSSPELSYFLATGDSLAGVSGKSDFLAFFDENKKLVSKYLKQHNIQFNKSSKEELRGLLEYCDGL